MKSQNDSNGESNEAEYRKQERIRTFIHGTIMVFTIVIGVAAIFQWKTFERTLRAALDANALTKEREYTELRPYVTIGNTNGELGTVEQDSPTTFRAALNFYNAGKTPANDFAVTLDSKNIQYRERWKVGDRTRISRQLGIATQVIASQQTINYRVIPSGIIIDNGLGQDRTAIGTFEYCDQWGNYTCGRFALTLENNKEGKLRIERAVMLQCEPEPRSHQPTEAAPYGLPWTKIDRCFQPSELKKDKNGEPQKQE